MRVVDYKVMNLILPLESQIKLVLTSTNCPYNDKREDIPYYNSNIQVGGSRCISCDFNIDYFTKSKKILCTADEEFEPNKKYSMLLIEKSY